MAPKIQTSQLPRCSMLSCSEPVGWVIFTPRGDRFESCDEHLSSHLIAGETLHAVVEVHPSVRRAPATPVRRAS